jgi:hypothetical protein
VDGVLIIVGAKVDKAGTCLLLFCSFAVKFVVRGLRIVILCVGTVFDLNYVSINDDPPMILIAPL